MRKKEIVERIKLRVESCYSDLRWARENGRNNITIESFRNRLDELILLYSQIKGISFVEACLWLEVAYDDVNATEELMEDKQKKHDANYTNSAEERFNKKNKAYIKARDRNATVKGFINNLKDKAIDGHISIANLNELAGDTNE